MERYRRIFCLALVSLIATVLYTNGHLVARSFIPYDTIYSSAQSEWYIPHDSIYIIDDQDFIVQGWSGNGSIANPFVIENLSIAIDGSGSCISVKDTTVHFIIRNCMLSSSAEYPEGNLVKLQFFNVENGNVENCSVIGQIDIQSSRHCRIFNNTIAPYEIDYVVYVYESHMINISYNIINPSIESEFGVFFRDSDDCILNQNVVKDNGWLHYPSTITTLRQVELASHDLSQLEPLQDIPDGGGITISGGSSCTVSENRIIENIGDGLRVYNSPDFVLIQNEIYDNDYGVTLINSDSSLISKNRITGHLEMVGSATATIRGNQLFGGSLQILYVDNLRDVIHVISNNTIDSWPLLYLVGESSITVEANKAGQIILANCSDTIIRNSIVEGFGRSIELYFCSNSALINGRCSKIFISDSNACNVENFDIDGHQSQSDSWVFGIYMGHSPQMMVKNNTIHNATRGVYLSHCSFSTISKNCIYEAEQAGIYVSHSDNTVIEENNIAYCAKPEYFSYYDVEQPNSAIDLFFSSHSIIINNKVLDNYGYGIRITTSNNVTVYYNRLSGNTEGNAYDRGTNNQWDDGVSMGNSWGDYAGVGMYIIPGSAGSIDRYPFGGNGSPTFNSNGSVPLQILAQWIAYASTFVGATIIVLYLWRRTDRVPQSDISV